MFNTLPSACALAQWTSSYGQVGIAGSFNGFDTNAANMILVANGVWQGYVVTTNLTDVEFFFAASTRTWGEDDQSGFALPLAGTAESPGITNIVVSNAFPAIARIQFNDQNGQYTVADVSLVSSSTNLWINEVDYDNPGTDSNEWIELVGPAGTSLDNYELALINQSGSEYETFDLADASFTFANEDAGFGFFVIGRIQDFYGVSPDHTPAGWTSNVIQNGPMDSIQLRRKSGTTTNVHLIDYGGDNTNTVEDTILIGIPDNGLDANKTIYLRGNDPGSSFTDFAWTNLTGNGTPGEANVIQTLAGGVQAASSVLYSNLTTIPPFPLAGESVALQVDIAAIDGASNLVVTAFYRIGTSGLFVPVSMSASGATYTTTSLIPGQPTGTRVEYYVSTLFDGTGTNSPALLPPGGSAAPAAYAIPRLPPGTVWINELNYNPDLFTVGTDTNEYIELVGTAGSDIGGWSIELLDAVTTYAVYTLPVPTVLPNDGEGHGFFVLGDSGVANVDMVFTNILSGTQSLAKRGAIRLRNEVGTLEEELSYGEPPPTDVYPDSLYIGYDDDFLFPPDPSLGLTGTGSNASDFAWTTNLVFTPGTTNDGQTLIEIILPEPEIIVIVDVSIGTNGVQILSTAPPTLEVHPEYSTNLLDELGWTIVPDFTNTYSNGTNTTTFVIPVTNAPSIFFRVTSGTPPDTPTPPVVEIVGIALGAQIELISTGTNTWSIVAEYTTNLVNDPGWIEVSGISNSFLDGTNTTVFDFPAPAAPHMEFRVRQIAPP